MSTEAILTIALTIIFGLPGLILFFKINRTKIIYLEKRVINLKEDLLKNFSELTIKYREVEITENVYFINGFLVCHGSKDIAKDSNKIKIQAPSNSKWLDIKIISKPDGLDLKTDLHEDRLEFGFNYLKSKEYIEFEGMIETRNQVKDKDLFKFSHRIHNVPRIKKHKIDSIKNSFGTILMGMAFFILPYLILTDMNDIGQFDLETRLVKNDSIAPYSLEINDKVDQIKSEIMENQSGFKLYLDGKTKNYQIQNEEITDKLEKIKMNYDIYFKMEPFGFTNWFFLVLAFLFIIIGLLITAVGFTNWVYEKRYLKIVSSN